ncbi:MAG: Txe/YoeB family addiction module toxin [Bacteroidales bacterium]|nr:Txe/YoeB family addiction module toxin [Bacteroidales bacterium]
MYQLVVTELAVKHLDFYKKTGNVTALRKIQKLFAELKEHPKTGTGKPEPLQGNLLGYYSRRIDQKNRMIYSINNNIVTVEVFSLLGHYRDK